MRPIRLGSVFIPPLTFGILVVLVACFIAAGLGANFVGGFSDNVLGYLPVVSSKVLDGQVWRLFTYALLHNLADPFHLIFNCLAIYFFGRGLEDRWGAGRYALFTVLTVVVGGVFVVAAGRLGIGNGAAFGASAFAEGLIVAWGLIYRDSEVRLMFAVPAKGIHMVWIAVFIWVLDAVSQSANSAAAHLGGMLTAAVLVLGVWRPNYVKAWWASLRSKLGGKKQPQLFVVPKPRDDDKKWIN